MKPAYESPEDKKYRNSRRKTLRGLALAIAGVVLVIITVSVVRQRHRARAAALLPNRMAWNEKAKQIVFEKKKEALDKPIDNAEFASLTQSELNLKAGELVANGYRRLAQAKHFERTVISRYPSGNYVIFDLKYLKGERGDLFKNETINIEGGTNQEIAGQSRTEINNDQGNWLISDQAGSENVAFLIASSDTRFPNTRGIKADIEKKAAGESPLSNRDYSISNQTSDGSPAIVVQTGTDGAQTQYVLDRSSGALISRYDEFNGTAVIENFDLNVNVTSSDFEIPAQNIIVPTSNVFAAQAYLMEKTKQQ